MTATKEDKTNFGVAGELNCIFHQSLLKDP